MRRLTIMAMATLLGSRLASAQIKEPLKGKSEVGDTTTHVAVGYGGGVKWFATRGVAARVDVRHVVELSGSKGLNNEVVTAGVSYVFQGAVPARPEAVEKPERPAVPPAASAM